MIYLLKDQFHVLLFLQIHQDQLNNSYKPSLCYLWALCTDIINSHKFQHIIAQIKFFDGRTFGYPPQELNGLKAWLIDSGPEEMKRHLLDEVLFYRYREKAEFESSQLGDLF